jgi:predicted NAD/FAD-binding protein
MPPLRSDWKAFNVCQQKDQPMCMLTAWLNEYYCDSTTFPVNVFETWNPHKTPENIINETHFLRVLHTADTPNILKEIDALQGMHGIYFAGAYSVEGMGLLEQAARSGRKVAELIQNHKLELSSRGTKESTIDLPNQGDTITSVNESPKTKEVNADNNASIRHRYNTRSTARK